MLNIPGRYYAKHTINHLVSNQARINQLNKNFKAQLKLKAIDYLQTAKISHEEKIKYLDSLQHDIFRYGKRYKYSCDLNKAEIREIVAASGDNELYKQIYGQTIQEYNNSYTLIGGIILAVFLIIFLRIIF